MYSLHNIKVLKNQKLILEIEKLNIAQDMFTVILGHNGSGKSTLLNLLARQEKTDEGQILFENKPLSKYSSRAFAQKVAFLAQYPPRHTGLDVEELVQLGRFPWRGYFSRWKNEDNIQVNQAIHQTGIVEYRTQNADTLSGGEKQRVWVAMLLAQQSPLLLLDEPTSALDVHHQYELMALFHQLKNDTGKGIVMVLHDINLACRYAERIIVMKNGRVAFDGDTKELLNEARLKTLFNVDMSLTSHPKRDETIAIVN